MLKEEVGWKIRYEYGPPTVVKKNKKSNLIMQFLYQLSRSHMITQLKEDDAE